MQSIRQKLPVYLQKKWRDNLSKKKSQDVTAGFKDLVDFVLYASESANDPVYSKEAMGQVQNKPN